MPHCTFTCLDPTTTTREVFTNNMTSVPIPPTADPFWSSAVRHQQNLYRALYDDPAMDPNRDQTFSTPAASKSRIYHMWDFVGRTLQYFYMLDYAKKPADRRGQEKSIWEDAVGRMAMSEFLVSGGGGPMETLMSMNVDVEVGFSEAIKEAARAKS